MRYQAAQAVMLICIGVLPGTASAQCGSVDRNSPAEVKREVERIYNEALNAMSYTLPSGVMAITWAPPNDAVHDQIQCLGSAAAPEISELLKHNERSFGRLLSIEMLGWIGGIEIVPPLRWALSRPGDFLITKTAALDSLNAAPPEAALPVVEEVLRSEKNPHVLEKAASMASKLRDSAKN